MSEPAAPSRSPRGRLLFVGDEPMPVQLTDRLHHPPVRVQNLFEAIGELASADARRPYSAALVSRARLPALGSRAAEALRRIDPSVRLILLIEGGQHEESRAAAGFDGCLEAPVDPDALDQLLGGGLLKTSEAAAPEGPGSAPTAPQASADEEPAAAEPQPSPPRPPSEPAGHAAGAGGLGDVDLLEAVMTGLDGVQQSALAVIRQRTGWDDLQLVPSDHIVPPQAACVEVRDGDRNYGKLVSGRASAAEIADWAQWLGRWLTLDASYCQYRLMAYRDDLTSAWNRRYFNRFLDECIAEAARRRRPVTVMIFDIDDFKRFNDEYGHESGDVILCETVALLNSVIRECDRVCRIGGDEFAVIFADLEGPREAGSEHPESVEEIARRFQRQICEMRFPKLGLEAPGTLSISAGLATYPWDGNDPAALLRLADQRALESKNRGKNHITFGADAAGSDPAGET